jgi:phenylalanyl-tRNA synthetase beta chain
MMDIGQPLHVFDKKKVKKPIIFSEKASGNMICLDNTTITIEENAITIESENKIHSLVGIIGGKESSVTRNTKEIIIESASLPKKYISTAIKLFNKISFSPSLTRRPNVPFA